LRYRTGTQWAVQGGRVVIPPNSLIDDTTPLAMPYWTGFVVGLMAPPDAEPLNQATRDWMVEGYKNDPTITIRPVGVG